ncbi:hypothetical protein [Arthrobacter sp. H35-D1]|uniref:hypothetical protein n=1 Tax=Arthrobacter sp. H35-D1 TaxID=3046202 RepID=UPI0024BAC907|nr:hypothetical protein [Arthrobacter sp. H35-D1]MDJ0311639.1 hypothetical protein [Arthrobacter sp. H35-D1]
MDTIDPLVWFAIGYGLVLLAVAHFLDILARRTAQRTVEWRSGGFHYHGDHDAWLCPQDQWLWPESFDPDNRVMRYRANPAVCNACPVKDSCTTSSSGRAMSRNVDPWPSSEAERFHRGIACAVVVLALAWPLATMIGARNGAELLVLAVTVLAIAAASWPLWSHLHRSPARFPDHVKVEVLDDTVARHASGSEREARRHTSYGSDHRPGPVPVQLTPPPHHAGTAVNAGETVKADTAGEHDKFATRWGSFGEPGGEATAPGRSRRKNTWPGSRS